MDGHAGDSPSSINARHLAEGFLSGLLRSDSSHQSLGLGNWPSDFDLHSLNHLHVGRKSWVGVTQEDMKQLEDKLVETGLAERAECAQFVRHNGFFYLEKLRFNGAFGLFSTGYPSAEAIRFAELPPEQPEEPRVEEAPPGALAADQDDLAQSHAGRGRLFKEALPPWNVQGKQTPPFVNKADTVVSAGTDAGKSLLYQAIPLVIPDAIVLVITPTIALMEDQQRSLAARGISAVALTAAAVKEDYTIWKRIDNGEFSIVLASPEILLATGSHFLTVTIGGKTSNAFCKRLACIAVDEAHLIWGWREFRQEYKNIGLLKSFFAKIPFLILSATMTNNVLGYIRKSLHLRAPIPLYERTLDRPNITYFVAEIRKPGYINETLIAEWREFDALRAHLRSRKTRFLVYMSSRMLESLRAGDSLVKACSKDSNRYENAIV